MEVRAKTRWSLWQNPFGFCGIGPDSDLLFLITHNLNMVCLAGGGEKSPGSLQWKGVSLLSDTGPAWEQKAPALFPAVDSLVSQPDANTLMVGQGCGLGGALIVKARERTSVPRDSFLPQTVCCALLPGLFHVWGYGGVQPSKVESLFHCSLTAPWGFIYLFAASPCSPSQGCKLHSPRCWWDED